MSREPLDSHLRSYYGSQQLDAATLGRLKQLARFETGAGASESPSRGSAGRRRFASRLAGVAAIAAALILLLPLFPGLRGDGGPEAMADSILREIALNHGKNLAIEFPADGYPGLREQMDKLDFSLRPPQGAGGDGFRMLGGRYCSIQGRLAAQIKLEDEAGRVFTLYETEFSEAFEGVSGQRRELDGIQVRVWREGGLLFGLAGSEI